ncbi:MAG: hypothetical protein ACLTCV_04790 [Oscillospiraceae bacterium]
MSGNGGLELVEDHQIRRHRLQADGPGVSASASMRSAMSTTVTTDRQRPT